MFQNPTLESICEKPQITWNKHILLKTHAKVLKNRSKYSTTVMLKLYISFVLTPLKIYLHVISCSRNLKKLEETERFQLVFKMAVIFLKFIWSLFWS